MGTRITVSNWNCPKNLKKIISGTNFYFIRVISWMIYRMIWLEHRYWKTELQSQNKLLPIFFENLWRCNIDTRWISPLTVSQKFWLEWHDFHVRYPKKLMLYFGSLESKLQKPSKCFYCYQIKPSNIWAISLIVEAWLSTFISLVLAVNWRGNIDFLLDSIWSQKHSFQFCNNEK